MIKGLPDSIWVGFDDLDRDGYWQPLEYEGVPDYCQYCKHQGHKETQCRIKARDIDINNNKEKYNQRQTRGTDQKDTGSNNADASHMAGKDIRAQQFHNGQDEQWKTHQPRNHVKGKMACIEIPTQINKIRTLKIDPKTKTRMPLRDTFQPRRYQKSKTNLMPYRKLVTNLTHPFR